MGLDMYLYVEEYISRKDYGKKDEQGLPADNQSFKEIAERLNTGKHIDKEDWTGLMVRVPVGYWRKANAIHAWFVDYCADGIDECQDIVVSRSELQELLNTCNEVLSNKEQAKELLDTQSGFFFGSTEIDEYYFQDLRYTASLVEKLLADETIDNVIYRASW